jgi:glutamine synthetase
MAYEQFHQDTETGPGVLETALAYTSALRMADNAQLFKYLAKSIGMKHGVVPSFMAKPWGNVRAVHPISLTRTIAKTR